MCIRDRYETRYLNREDNTWREKKVCLKNTLNLYDFMHWRIKPMCEKRRCSYVQLVATEPQKPVWFVSHWWGEAVLDFIRWLNKHAEVSRAAS